MTAGVENSEGETEACVLGLKRVVVLVGTRAVRQEPAKEEEPRMQRN